MMYRTCQNCSKPKGYSNRPLCRSCGHSRSYATEMQTLDDSYKDELYQIWYHHKTSGHHDLTFTQFKKKYGTEVKGEMTMTANGLRWAKSAKAHHEKRSGLSSSYLGVIGRVKKSGMVYYFATIDGRYLKGSYSKTEDEAAQIRDDYIIKHKLDKRLNF